MRDNSKEPKLTYALDSSGKMIHINRVERGLSCNCRCPKCNEYLVARLGNEGGRQPHFAHRKCSDCHGSYMSALHKLAEQIIEEEKAVMVPAYKEIDKQKLAFKEVEVEQRVERKDLQPDIVGVTPNGLRWFIEIRNTHEVDEAKRAKLIESNITCLEIDVREQTLENLKLFLLESTENREWINNPIYDKKIEDLYREKVSIIVKQFKDNPIIEIPQGDDIVLQNLNVSVSEDGQYAEIKAVSSNGIPYLFHIGCHEVLAHVKPKRDSNELLIDTDKNHFINGYVSELSIERLYLYVPREKEIVHKEHGFEVRPKIECVFDCRYKPSDGKCIYSKEIISYKGIDWVVCNREKRLKEEAVVSSQKQISISHLSSSTRFERKNEGSQEDRYYTKVSPIKPKHEKSVVLSQSNPSPDTLPFDRFWTTEEYYTQLQSTSYYEIEKGLLAEIVKCDRTNSGILLLYRDSTGIRSYWPFHIAIIYVSNGDLIRNKVADFTNKKAALDSYYLRLRTMRESVNLKPSEEVRDFELPF